MGCGRILIVDDDMLAACYTQAVLEETGFDSAAIAAGLAEGEAFLAQETPVLAILDINIGHNLVFPFAAQLLERRVPIIFLTGSDRSILPAGWNGPPFLSKPPSKETLTAALTAAGIAIDPAVSGIEE